MIIKVESSISQVTSESFYTVQITEGSGASRGMVPPLFTLLLQFSSYSCQAPSYGNVLTRPHTTKGSVSIEVFKTGLLLFKGVLVVNCWQSGELLLIL